MVDNSAHAMTARAMTHATAGPAGNTTAGGCQSNDCGQGGEPRAQDDVPSTGDQADRAAPALAVAAVVAAVLAGVSACGSAGRGSPGASPAASGSVSAYLDRLSQHGGTGARTHVGLLRPAAGALAAAARTFTGCLRSGVVVPAAPPRPCAGGAPKSVLSLRSGSLRQRPAVSSCRSAALSGKAASY